MIQNFAQMYSNLMIELLHYPYVIIRMNKTMYNTLEVRPSRDVYTSQERTRDHMQLSYRQSLTARPSERKYRIHQCDLLHTHRPATTATIDSNVSYCKPKQGQLFLKQSLRDDLNKYLIRRIRSDTKKHEQSFTEQQFELPNQIDALYESQRERNIPKNYFSSRICGILQPSVNHVTKVIAEPFLLNCREKLRRMVEKKRENESKFSEVRNKIQSAVKAKEPLVVFRNHQVYIEGREDLRSQSVNMAQTISTDRDYSQMRYKRRLVGRHSRNNGQY